MLFFGSKGFQPTLTQSTPSTTTFHFKRRWRASSFSLLVGEKETFGLGNLGRLEMNMRTYAKEAVKVRA
jgi:hypothetical protein